MDKWLTPKGEKLMCYQKYLIEFYFCMILSLSGIPSFAQDIHLSQPFMNPILLNPALTAEGDADWRVMANYRSQWRSLGTPFITNSLGFDKKLVLLDQHIGVGGLVLYDQSGDGNLTNFGAGFSVSYERSIGQLLLRGGLSGTYITKQIDLNKLTFPEQYDRTQGGFNSTFDNLEPVSAVTSSFFDLTLGINASYQFNKRFSAGFGVSNYHLNQPTESIFAEDNKRKPFYNYQIFAAYAYNSRLTFEPYFVYSFLSKASQLLVGTELNYTLIDQPQQIEYVIGGIGARAGFNRNFDALIAKVGIGFKRLEVGVSYDFTLSTLRQVANHRGALEFGVIWKGASSILPFKQLPCERL
jgi:type IX secretion system PorP/SprF family membrane protein